MLPTTRILSTVGGTRDNGADRAENQIAEADTPVPTMIACFILMPQQAESLKRAGVPHFPIYNLRHTSPETKRHYQLGMADQVRQAMEKSNKKAYGRGRLLHFYDSGPNAKKEGAKAVSN